MLPLSDPLPGFGLPVPPLWPDTILPLEQRVPSDLLNSFLDSNYLEKPVDWAYIGLWDSAQADTAIISFSCLLLENGELVLPTFAPLDVFLLPLPPGLDSAHISIWVPGHLALITANPVDLTQPLTQLNFSDPLLPVPPQMDRIQVSTQVVLLPSGDSNADGAIDAADRANTWNERNTTGYSEDDVTRDGAVNAADRAQCWNNRNMQGKPVK
ncbi:MAG: hypothetical protein R3B47_06010 [Bacteroidia bacterium]